MDVLRIKSFDDIYWLPFQDQPDNRPIGPTLYRLFSPAELYWIGIAGKIAGKFKTRIGTGFLNDNQSVPQMFWTITGLHPDGPERMGAVPHDAFYRTEGGLYPDRLTEAQEPLLLVYCAPEGPDMPVVLSRKACDQVYMAACRSERPKGKKWALGYAALRIAGARYFGGPCPGAR